MKKIYFGRQYLFCLGASLGPEEAEFVLDAIEDGAPQYEGGILIDILPLIGVGVLEQRGTL